MGAGKLRRTKNNLSAPLSSDKCDHLLTPLSYQKLSSKPITRRLWENNEERERWDVINAPQFVDFCNIPDVKDSFFDKMIPIASTPLPDHRNPSLMASLQESHDIIASLSGISFCSANETVKEAQNYKKNEKNEARVVQNAVVNTNREEATDNKIKQPRIVIKPFSFDERQKLWEARRQERMNKDCKTTKPKKDFRHVKPPLLLTAARALERKRFDDAIKEKEKKREEQKKMESILKKKQEERELAKLRSETIHKAQPVPDYKSGLPSFRKRPVTEPLTPVVLKRRRRH